MNTADGKRTATESLFNPCFTDTFKKALADLARRYANDPTVLGMFATPGGPTYSFGIDDTEPGRQAWAAYATRTAFRRTCREFRPWELSSCRRQGPTT